jgi:PAS domain S-box-containing protein
MKSKFANVALRTSLIYGLVGGAWILLSDRALVAFVPDPEVLDKLEIYKGWAFVAVTALLLYAALRSQLRRLEQEAAERKRAEESIVHERQLLRTLIDLLPETFYIKDRDSRFLVANAALARHFGKENPSQILGLSDADFFPAELAAKYRAEEVKVFEGEPLIDHEGKNLSPNGQVCTCLTTKVPFRDNQGRIRGLVGIGRDITDRKRAEQDLQMFEFSIDQASDAVFWMTRDAGFSYVNEQACHSLGYTREELMRLHLWDIDPIYPKARWDAEWKQFQKNKQGGAQQVETFHRRKDGSIFSVSISSKHLWFGDTELHVAVARDITQHKQAEDKLAYERELFQALLENSPDSIYFKDRESRFVRVSQKKVERTLQTVRENYLATHPDPAPNEWPPHLAGVEPFGDWLIGKTDFDTCPEAYARAAYEDEQEIIRTGRHMLGKLEKALLPDGKSAWRLTTKKPWRDKDGNIIGTFGVSVDVTALKEVEAALNRERLLLRTLIDLLPEALFVKDLNSRFLVVNKALAKQHFGKDNPDHVLGKCDMDFFPPAMAAGFRAEEEKVLAGESLIDHEEQVDLAGGRKCTLLTTKVPFRDGQDKICGLVGIGRDITERKRTEAANARLATAVEQAAEAIVITDPKGTILYVNPAFERITGYTSPEAVGQSPRILKSGKHDAAFYQQMWDTLSRGKVWTGRIINKKKNGTLYEEEISISPVFVSDGKIANFVAVKRDVTQEVALETQLRQSQKMEIIGQLAGGVSHDFNNILTVIQGNASLLLNAELKPAEKTECTQQILHAAERAASLTRQLLIFSRKQVMQPANLSLNEVVEQMTKMLRRVLGENISLQSNYAANLPLIHGDPGMIEQVLMNLVVNARDAMPAGGSLTIATGVRRFDNEQAEQIPGASPGLHVWLAVSDTGSGIAPEILSHIFEPFFTTKEVGKGTGLGLATVYGIMQQHHGWITVTSEVNKGTTFQIQFPAVAKAELEEKAELLIA